MYLLWEVQQISKSNVFSPQILPNSVAQIWALISITWCVLVMSDSVIPGTVACQEFSRQEDCCGLPFPSPWVAIASSGGSSQPRDWTQVSRIAGQFFFFFFRPIVYCLSHQGSPRILEWVAYPFSSGSSWPRNQTRVFCIAGRFFTNWAIPIWIMCLS